MPFSSQQLDLIKTVKRHLPAGMHACLVGGALRDMLLGMPLRDMDFILPGNTRQVARAVAKNLGALSFLLDAERNTMRVIHSRPEDGDFYLDFIQQTGETIQEDLKARDFTINAMALGLDDLDQLIDPLNGLMDLHAKVLKACSPGAMLADPLRCLRGLRLSNSLGFHLEKNTITQIRKALPQLDRSAPERIRDEIFRLFNESHPERALRALDVLGGMELLFPELMPFKKTEETDPNLPNSQEPRLATLASLQELFLIFREFCLD
jgi:tRNA nucleotidyltransferase/poly(A) polymerase